jgi:type III secretion protein T
METLIEAAMPTLTRLALALPRWLVFLSFLPLFSTRTLGGVSRNAAAIALALPLLPSLSMPLTTPGPPFAQLALLMLKEAGIGLVLGGAAAVPFWAVEMAGTYIDNQRGANMQAVNPLASADASVLGGLLQQALALVVVHAGLVPPLLGAVYDSFTAWPPAAWSPPLDGPAREALVSQLTRAMTLGLMLACPALVGLGLVELGFALVSRWVPQVPAYFAALPVKSLTALFIVALSIHVLDSEAKRAQDHTIDFLRMLVAPRIPDAARHTTTHGARGAMRDSQRPMREAR